MYLTGPKKSRSYSLSSFTIAGKGSLNKINGNAKFEQEFLNFDMSNPFLIYIDFFINSLQL